MAQQTLQSRLPSFGAPLPERPVAEARFLAHGAALLAVRRFADGASPEDAHDQKNGQNDKPHAGEIADDHGVRISGHRSSVKDGADFCPESARDQPRKERVFGEKRVGGNGREGGERGAGARVSA